MVQYTEITSIELQDWQLKSLDKASNSILIVPEKWHEDAESRLYEATSQSVLKLLRKESISVEPLDPLDSKVSFQDSRGLEWVAPTLVVSGMLLAENPEIISMALNVLAKYISDIFKGRDKDPAVRLNVVFVSSKRKDTRKIQFKGPASALSEVNKILSELEKA